MPFMRTRTAVVTAAGLLAGASLALASPAVGAGQANRPSSSKDITGGSFENPAVVAPFHWRTFALGESFDGWNITAGTVDLVDGRWQAADGSQSVDLSGIGPGAVSQTFPTVPGATYMVSYSLAGNPEGGFPPLKTGAVLANGLQIETFSFDVTGKTATDMGWSPRSFTFQATGATTTLTFASTSASTAGPALDNVRVQGCGGGCGT
jgi:choice-of-anchor C domain-containing protein